MRSGINATGKSGNHRKPRFAEIMRQTFGETRANHRSVARTDNGHGRLAENASISPDRYQRRRGFTISQLRRIIRLPHSNQTGSNAFDGLKLALCIIHGHDTDRT